MSLVEFFLEGFINEKVTVYLEKEGKGQFINGHLKSGERKLSLTFLKEGKTYIMEITKPNFGKSDRKTYEKRLKGGRK